MPHASWKGFLQLSLVTVPVQAYNAAAPGKGDISFNQLHDKCKSRIKYVKTCPLHGEIRNDEIVKGYEYSKGEYVIVNEEELEQLRGKKDPAVQIDTFIKPGTIEPEYFDGRSYYLVPDGPLARKPYAVLLDVLRSKNLWGVAVATISNRDQLAVLRAGDEALCLDTLHYAAELRAATDVWEERELPKVDREEAKLAATLIDATTSKSFDLAKYQDHYNEELRTVLEAKVEGREVVAPQQVERVPVINLVDALKKSISVSGKAATAKRVAQATLSRATKPRKTVRRKSAG